MLSVQPALAKSLFRFDPETGSLSAVMGQPERASALPARSRPAPAEPAAGTAGAGRAGRGCGSTESPMTLARIERLPAGLAADQPELARLLGMRTALLRAGDDDRAAVRAELAAAWPPAPPPPGVPPSAPCRRRAGARRSGLEDDAEMREIFIEEAREVIADAREALERLADTPETPAT